MGKKLLYLALAVGAMGFTRSGGSTAQAAVAFPAARPGLGVPAGLYSPFAGWGLTRARRFGPYASLRRASNVARYFRARGYNARVVYAGAPAFGAPAYVVRVW